MTCLNRRRLKVFAAGLVALGVLVNVASATHSWGGYHWARTTPQFTGVSTILCKQILSSCF